MSNESQRHAAQQTGPAGAGLLATEPSGAGPLGVGSAGAGLLTAEPGNAESLGAEPGGAELLGVGSMGAGRQLLVPSCDPVRSPGNVYLLGHCHTPLLSYGQQSESVA